MADDGNSPQVLASFPTAIGATNIINALRDYGIEAFSAGEHTAGFKAEAPGEVQVLVRRDDLKSAQKMLKKIRAELKAIDWSQVDVGEPEDHSSDDHD